MSFPIPIPGIPWLKLLGGLALGVAVIAAGWLIKDRFRLAAIVNDAKACEAASRTETLALTPCTAPMRAEIEQARQARQCDRALGQVDRASALFEIRATCTSKVLLEVASLAASEGNLSDARATIVTLSQGQAAAVERAEARALSLSDQRKQADAAVTAAPRVAGGIARCDADCLRRLSGS